MEALPPSAFKRPFVFPVARDGEEEGSGLDFALIERTTIAVGVVVGFAVLLIGLGMWFGPGWYRRRRERLRRLEIEQNGGIDLGAQNGSGEQLPPYKASTGDAATESSSAAGGQVEEPAPAAAATKGFKDGETPAWIKAMRSA